MVRGALRSKAPELDAEAQGPRRERTQDGDGAFLLADVCPSELVHQLIIVDSFRVCGAILHIQISSFVLLL